MKRFLSGLLCLILALSMMLVFTACDDQESPPKDNNDNQTPVIDDSDTDGSNKNVMTSSAALSAMKAELGKKDCFAFTTSLSFGENVATAVQIGTVTVKADAECRLFAAAEVDVVALMGIKAGDAEEYDMPDDDSAYPEVILRAEVYVVESGVYAGTNKDAFDQDGNSVMTYYAVPNVTSEMLKQIRSEISELFSDSNTSESTENNNNDNSVTVIPGFDLNAILGGVETKDSLTKTENGYVVNGSVNLAPAVSTLLATVKRMILPLMVNQLVEMVLPQATVVGYLDTLSDKTVSAALLMLDDAIGADMTNTLLAEITAQMGLTLGDTPEEVRTTFDAMAGAQDLIALVLSMMDEDAGKAYAALTTPEEKHSFFVLAVSNLYQQLPTTKVGDLEITSDGATLSEMLDAIKKVTELRASASLTLTDAFLPTALHTESVVDITIDQQTIKGAVVTDTAFTFEVGAITLPEALLLAPSVTDRNSSWSYDASDDGETEYVTFSTTIMIDAESFEISEATISVAGLAEDAYFSATPAVIDAETGTVTIQATYATDDKTGEGVPTVEITLTATVGDSTVYVFITEEY